MSYLIDNNNIKTNNTTAYKCIISYLPPFINYFGRCVFQSNSIKVQPKLEQLPAELLHSALEYLNENDLARFSQVNKLSKSFAAEHSFKMIVRTGLGSNLH